MQDELADYRFNQPLTWRSLYDLTFYSTRYYEGQNGSFGYPYLPLLMLSMVAIWKARNSKAAWAMSVGWLALAIILAGVPNARYTYPALPLILVGGAVVLAVLEASDLRLYRAAIVCLLATAGPERLVSAHVQLVPSRLLPAPTVCRSRPSGIHPLPGADSRSGLVRQRPHNGACADRPQFGDRRNSPTDLFEQLAQLEPSPATSIAPPSVGLPSAGYEVEHPVFHRPERARKG
jgi:hypothetical protein